MSTATPKRHAVLSHGMNLLSFNGARALLSHLLPSVLPRYQDDRNMSSHLVEHPAPLHLTHTKKTYINKHIEILIIFESLLCHPYSKLFLNKNIKRFLIKIQSQNNSTPQSYGSD